MIMSDPCVASGCFQDVTMRLIAIRLLPDTPGGSAEPRRVYVQGEIINKKPKLKKLAAG